MSYKKIKSVEIEGKQVYFKKGLLGYRVVQPIILPDENGKPDWNTFNWKNLFNKKGFITLGILLLFLLFGYLAFQEQLTNYHNVMSNPWAYCIDCQSHTLDVLKNTSFVVHNFTLPEINFSDVSINK